MKKIVVGFLGIFLVLGIVAGAGYALFSSQVTMTGMVLGSGTPLLEISFYNKDDTDWRDYHSSLDFAGQSFQKLLPGEYDWGAFWLRNNSTDGHPEDEYQETLDFSLKGSILTAGGDWSLLKEVILMRVCVYDVTDENRCDPTQKTGWSTMKSWRTDPKNLPGGYLLSGEERAYVVNFYIPSDYGNPVSGLTITDMTMEVTGTQVQ